MIFLTVRLIKLCKGILHKCPIFILFFFFLAVIPSTALRLVSLQWLSNGPSPWKGKRIILCLLLQWNMQHSTAISCSFPSHIHFLPLFSSSSPSSSSFFPVSFYSYLFPTLAIIYEVCAMCQPLWQGLDLKFKFKIAPFLHGTHCKGHKYSYMLEIQYDHCSVQVCTKD